MTTRIDEIAAGLFRFSTYVPHIAPPAGFTFNQFLVMGEEPLLFHLGHRKTFPTTMEALTRVLPLEKLRWLSFGHIEADECGAMNEWLAAAPNAEVVHGILGARVSINDLADRPARVLGGEEALDIGGRRLRFIDTPHVPHGWEAGVLFEETTNTLLCGDLFTHTGDGPPLTGADIVGPAEAAEAMFGFSSLSPTTGATLRRLAALEPRILALMHGSSFEGDGSAALRDLAGRYDGMVRAALEAS
ncbi:MAG: MBL fold metallo-hydrolase [Acetobacteraceae bacterium]|nr:MBL fold metallo-hydrolase [Acetobacteraceae bacterium]